MTTRRKLGISAAVVVLIGAVVFITLSSSDSASMRATFVRYDSASNGVWAVIELENPNGTEMFYWAAAFPARFETEHALLPWIAKGSIAPHETLEIGVPLLEPYPKMKLLCLENPSPLRAAVMRLFRKAGIHTHSKRWETSLDVPQPPELPSRYQPHSSSPE